MANGIINPGELDLNLLWALDALLTEKHVSRAAERIHLGQPAMSAALKRLRFIFKDELLVRQGNHYHLTPLAAELEQPLHDVLKEIGRLFTHRPSFDPATSDRSFVISAGEYASDLISSVLEPVLREAPGVSIDLRRLNRSSYDDFQEGVIDLIIHAPEMVAAGSALADAPSTPIFRDRWVCAVDNNHPQIGDRLSMENYQALPQVGYGSEGRPRPTQKVLEWAEPRLVDVWTHSFLSIPSLVKGTKMFAIIPVLLGKMLTGSGEVRLIELPFEAPPIEYWMYWPPMYETDPGNTWLRDHLMKSARQLEVEYLKTLAG